MVNPWKGKGKKNEASNVEIWMDLIDWVGRPVGIEGRGNSRGLLKLGNLAERE